MLVEKETKYKEVEFVDWLSFKQRQRLHKKSISTLSFLKQDIEEIEDYLYVIEKAKTLLVKRLITSQFENKRKHQECALFAI